MEYEAEPSPDNHKQSSLGPLLSHLAVPALPYPSNRLARLLVSKLPARHSMDEDALHCLECDVRFSVVTRRVRSYLSFSSFIL